MNVVKITNKIALVTVIGLMYWVFIFISSTVFGFKVFKENMTEMFLLSIFGIFAILTGAIILNIMFNLTAIAEGRGTVNTGTEKSYKTAVIAFVGSLVVIFFLLYAGDIATSKLKENHLVKSATELLEEQKEILNLLSDYAFTKEYIEAAGQNIKILSEIEEKFPRVTIIARDSINGRAVLLGFGNYTGLGNDEEPRKPDYILSTSSDERKYLNAVFDGETKKYQFSSSEGRYEIYYPVKTEKGLIVIHLSQHSRYGKFGS